MANKVYASGVRLSTMDDLMNTKEELLDLFNNIEDINKYILIPKLDQNGNLDWKYLVEQLPEDEEGNKIYSWFILPRDKDLGTYNQEGVFTPELGYYNQDTFDYEEDDHVNKKPHGIRLFRIVYMLKSGVWTIDTDLLTLPNAFRGGNSSSMTLGSGWASTETEPFSLPSISRYDLVTREDLLSYANKTYVDNNIRNVSNNRIPIRHINQSPFIIQGKTPGIYHISGFGSNTISMRVGTNSSNITSSSIKDKLIYVVKEYKNLSELIIGDTLAYYFEYSGNTIKRITLTYDNVYQPGRLCQIENETVASYALPSDLNNYLSKTNTTSYTPTANYHPATKYYVDSKVALPTLTIMPSQMISQTQCQLTQEQIDLLSDESIGAIYLIGENLGMLNGVANKAAFYTLNDEDYVELLSIYTNSNSDMPRIMRGLCNVTTGIATLSLSGLLSTTNSEEYIPTQPYHPATKDYVDNNKGQIIQYSIMPTASEETVGKVAQYIGITDQNFTNGYFYTVIANTPEDSADPTTYTWEQLEVQPGGGGSTPEGEYYMTTPFNYADTGTVTSGDILTEFSQIVTDMRAKSLSSCVIHAKDNSSGSFYVEITLRGYLNFNYLSLSYTFPLSYASIIYNNAYTSYLLSVEGTWSDNDTVFTATQLDKVDTAPAITRQGQLATKQYVDDNSIPFIENGTFDLSDPNLEDGIYYIKGNNTVIKHTATQRYPDSWQDTFLPFEYSTGILFVTMDTGWSGDKAAIAYYSVMGGPIIKYFTPTGSLGSLPLDRVLRTDLPATINYLYTFNHYTPKTNVAPTDNDDLTNKAYVDNSILLKAYELAGLTEYDSTNTYDTGDYVYYENLIYKCNTDDTTGTWDSTKWDTKTYMEYMSDILIGGALGGGY